MKLASPLLNATVDFSDSDVWNVVVENPVLMRKIILGLQDIWADKANGFLLYDDGKLLPLKDYVEVFQAVLPFDINTRELLTALLKRVEKKALNPQMYLETQTKLQAILGYLTGLTQDFQVPISFEKLTVSTLVKAAGMEIVPDDNRLHCLLVQYMKLVRELVHERIFVFVHLMEILSKDECETLFHELQLNHFKTILLESRQHNIAQDAMTLIVDGDLCEISGRYPADIAPQNGKPLALEDENIVMTTLG